MENKLVFAIDCDDVLRDSLPNMVRIYNEEIGDNKRVEDITDYDVSKSFPRIEAETGILAREWFFDCHGKDIFLNSKPIKGARKAVEILKKYGTVVIVTRQQSCENKLDTISWLCKNRLMCDDICFLKDKRLFKCDYMIDDYLGNFVGANAENAILISAPHNEKFTDKHDDGLTEILRNSKNISTAERFKSILEFAQSFEKEAEKVKSIIDKNLK